MVLPRISCDAASLASHIGLDYKFCNLPSQQLVEFFKVEWEGKLSLNSNSRVGSKE